MGGPHWNKPGSGSNYLCLPKYPYYDDDIDYEAMDEMDEAPLLGWISAASLQTESYEGLSPLKDGDYVHGNDVHCSVCQAERSSVAMIPAHVRLQHIDFCDAPNRFQLSSYIPITSFT